MSRQVIVEMPYGHEKGKVLRFDYQQPFYGSQSDYMHGHYVALVELDDGRLTESRAENITLLDALESKREPAQDKKIAPPPEFIEKSSFLCSDCGENIDLAAPVGCKNPDHIPF